MLDTETKRRIDTARDILVGKVPDPKSQVEQITIALIYKFMDDLDALSEELGGQRKFFAHDFAHYGWTKLMRAGLGGHAMLNLYAEAIERMPQNPGIPPLFRSIFNNAYLPYRDPQTLRAFLKVINEFTYDHSERLGDAFEYLLSVLGSQGDAGQFRTPRHIIDFMVALLNPQKEERVLDPACGTAGFLISAYKHILAANTDDQGHSTLTPAERGQLAANICGYDISPDMVRLSLVNLYLHRFVDPHIYEYDTLTSEERWHEYADVILANPPFMTPKGGIRPHSRFVVRSKRSEVLFVSYIAEHLTSVGRAGIIVPEGIIFQSQQAYKQLRKLLVEEMLVAVVSLPSGVFQPYSGVKTSILILDRALARRVEHIAFFKIEHDGYDLGAQRRPIERDDLPLVRGELSAYLGRVRSGEVVDVLQSDVGLVVEKGKIAGNGEYNLSGERYREKGVNETKYEWVELGEIILDKPQYGSVARKVPYDGKVRYVRITDLTDRGELKPDDPVSPSVIQPDRFLEPGDLLIARSGSVGRTYLHGNLLGTYQYAGYLIRFRIDPTKALPEYVFHISKSDSWWEWIVSNSKTGTLTNINAKQYSSFRLPLPPLEVQREIVAEIEGYQKVIDGARMVVDNYRPHLHVDPEWPLVEIKEIASVESGFRFPNFYQGKMDEEIPFLKVSDMNLPGNEMLITSWNNAVSRDILSELKAKSYPAGTVIFPKIGAAINTNKKRILSCDSTYDNNVLGIVPNTTKILSDFLYAYLLEFDLRNWASDAQPPSMRKTVVERHLMPLPSLATQQEIVAEIKAEQTLIAASRELVECFERKIQAAIGRVWGT